MPATLPQPQVVVDAFSWTSLVGPAVVAAAISGLVSTIGIWISAQNARRIHRDKLNFDKEQAEQRAAAEIALADRKITADIELANKKQALDRTLAAWKRRTEFAEELLADFYQANDIIRAARSPAGFSNEGGTRTKFDWESESDTQALNSYFAATERLQAMSEFFGQIFARRYRSIALFGQEVGKPFDDLVRIRGEVMIGVRNLIANYRRRNTIPQESWQRWEERIWDSGEDNDVVNSRLTAMVQAIEQICKPVIQDIVP